MLRVRVRVRFWVYDGHGVDAFDQIYKVAEVRIVGGSNFVPQAHARTHAHTHTYARTHARTDTRLRLRVRACVEGRSV